MSARRMEEGSKEPVPDYGGNERLGGHKSET